VVGVDNVTMPVTSGQRGWSDPMYESRLTDALRRLTTAGTDD
jgi:hypothetical protein